MEKKRDHRQAAIQSFTHACAEDERVTVALLGGSFATGLEDERSDLDLYFLILFEKYPEFFAKRHEFFKGFAVPVFLENFHDFGFDMLVFILNNGVEGELSMASDDNFLHIHGGTYKVLVDKKELLSDVVFPLQGPSQTDQVEILRKHLWWFWRDLSLFCVAIDRGQKWSANGYLESMRLRCVKLARLDWDFTSWASGYERVEKSADARSLELIECSFPTPAVDSMVKAANELIIFYRTIVPNLARKNNLEYPISLEELILARESKLLGRISPTSYS
jgi:predicted nucleotidyltransferase